MEKNRIGAFHFTEAASIQKEAYPGPGKSDDYEHKGLLKDYIHHQFEQEDADGEISPALEALLARALQKIIVRIHSGDHSSATG